jgi:hypothetical protein
MLVCGLFSLVMAVEPTTTPVADRDRPWSPMRQTLQKETLGIHRTT